MSTDSPQPCPVRDRELATISPWTVHVRALSLIVGMQRPVLVRSLSLDSPQCGHATVWLVRKQATAWAQTIRNHRAISHWQSRACLAPPLYGSLAPSM